MRMRKKVLTAALFLAMVAAANATLQISVATDKPTYQTGETVEVYVSIYNPTSEDVTLHLAIPSARYLMDDTYFWRQNTIVIYWVNPPVETLLEAGQRLTWQLDHDAIENEKYYLGVGIHSVKGYVYSYETIGQTSEPVTFEVLPEPMTLSFFGLGFLILRKKK